MRGLRLEIQRLSINVYYWFRKMDKNFRLDKTNGGLRNNVLRGIIRQPEDFLRLVWILVAFQVMRIILMMRPKFREDKATEAACFLIRKEGGSISYMKLIKLMYLADRSRLLSRGRPITFDRYCSLQHGPVLSRTLDLITSGVSEGQSSIWKQYISAPSDYCVEVNEGVSPIAVLSQAELGTLEEIYSRFGHFNKWDLVNWCHENLTEWEDPDGSAVAIEYRDILMEGGKTEFETQKIEGELESLALADRIFSKP